ncbi:MAG: Crp/Fnr family transcriptional regulator [Lachnospiraceae bacterium]|nr:Crp/Fnr family transcriptional regulator [Lachnospiraceae bacterium]
MFDNKYLKQLKDVNLFREVRPEEFPAMLGCIGAFVKEYSKDEIINLTESNRKYIGIVLSGNIHMIQEDIWGNRAIILNISKNDLFGETFACGGEDTGNVIFTAVEKSEVMILPFARIMHTCASACSHHQKVIMNMVSVLAEKNVSLMSKIDVISKNTLREKLISYLTKEIERQHPELSRAETFPISITLSLGRQQLAEYIHANRSAVFRELNQMKDEGLLVFENKNFKILKKLE